MPTPLVLSAWHRTTFLDDAVLVEQGAAPAQVDRIGLDWPTAHHDAGVGRVVCDGVQHLARHIGHAVDLFDACVDDLDDGRYVVGRGEHVKAAYVGATQVALQDEGEFDFDPRESETCGRNVGALAKEHVVEQRAIVRLGDIGGHLHRT